MTCGSMPLAATHADEGKKEFQPGPARSIGDHLDFVDHHNAGLLQNMGMRKSNRGKFFVCEQRYVIMSAEDRRDVIRFSRCLNDT